MKRILCILTALAFLFAVPITTAPSFAQPPPGQQYGTHHKKPKKHYKKHRKPRHHKKYHKKHYKKRHHRPPQHRASL